ncbi:MAG: rhomboid family intramembrane serine protease [Mucilaginibacter sp.]
MNFCNALQAFLKAPVTYSLIVLISLFSLISFFDKRFFYRMVLHPYEFIRRRHYYQLFTADLVHNDVQHFLVNGISLFFIGGDLERYLRGISCWGSLQFAAIYMASLLTGNMLMIFWHRHDAEFSTAGASGSIMGCVFSFMFLKPGKVAFYLPVLGGLSNGYYALIYILAMILMRKRIARAGANYEVHFWGAIGGLAMTLALKLLLK